MSLDLDFSDVTPYQVVSAAGLAIITLFCTHLCFWGARRVELGNGNNLRATGLFILALGSYATAGTLGLVPYFSFFRGPPAPHTPS